MVYLAQSIRVGIRRPTETDCDEFVAMVDASRDVHEPWVYPPSTRDEFSRYLHSRDGITNDGFLVCDLASAKIAGVVNANCIVWGHFHSAYLGYYISGAFAGRGYMTEAIRLVARYTFGTLGLHRLEANIQPQNLASIAVARKCGFRKEGFSPRYLKVGGEWRDHERWALLAEELPVGGS